MNEIIKVDNDTMTVSARDLHKQVGSTERFSAWFDRQLQFGFIEGEDYSNPLKVLRVQNEGGREVSREVIDYSLSVDMAKQICMVQKNENAKIIRQYLIDLEKAWNTPEMMMARGLQAAQKMIEQKDEQIKALTADNERMKPKEIFADAVTASDSSILVRDFAKMMRQNGVEIGEKRLYRWFRENGYICQKSTEPTQKAMEMGLFERIVRTVQRGDKLPLETATTKITGKGQVYFANKLMAA